MVRGYEAPSLISTSWRSAIVTRPRTLASDFPRNSITYCWVGLPDARNRMTELSERSRSMAARSERSRRIRGDSCIGVVFPDVISRQAIRSAPARDDLGVNDQVIAILNARLD